LERQCQRIGFGELQQSTDLVRMVRSYSFRAALTCSEVNADRSLSIEVLAILFNIFFYVWDTVRPVVVSESRIVTAEINAVFRMKHSRCVLVGLRNQHVDQTGLHHAVLPFLALFSIF
jgi:hypothetical protein